MKNLELMADYYCFPLWTTSDEGPENVEPSSLPLSRELERDLLAWSERFDAILVVDDPEASNFASPEEEDRFNADGRALATRLAEELAHAFEVTFVNTYGRKAVINRPRRLEESNSREVQRGSGAGASRRPGGFETLVGPVRSVYEVAGLRRMDASGASFLLGPHPIFPDDRIISLPSARRVCDQLPGRHGIILSPSMTREYLGELFASIAVSFVEFDIRLPPERQVIEFARSRGLELLAGGLEVEHDQDPEWLAGHLEDATKRFQPDLFVVTLVPSWRDPYGWFTKEAGEHSEDLTQAQVNAVLTRYPVVVNMALGDHSPQVLRDLFPGARGSYTYIGRPRDNCGTPAFCPPPP